MKTDSLDKCLEILSYWQDHADSTLRYKLLSTETDFREEYIEPFSRELAENIIETNSEKGLEKLIVYYITALSRVAWIEFDYESIDHTEFLDDRYDFPTSYLSLKNPHGSDLEENDIDDGDDDYTYAMVRAHYLYSLLFEEIQVFCIGYNIPFIDLCNKLAFNLMAINTEITLAHEKKKNFPSSSNLIEKSDQVEIPLLKKSESEIETELVHIKRSENQFWKSIPMEKVISHFMIMTTKNSPNGEPYLSMKQLISFLKRGFLSDTTQPIQKINCPSRKKGLVIKRFYEFYTLAVSNYGCPPRKDRFINLLTDCFNNWTPKTVKPFFRSDQTADNW
jgi:hypothetical protein